MNPATLSLIPPPMYHPQPNAAAVAKGGRTGFTASGEGAPTPVSSSLNALVTAELVRPQFAGSVEAAGWLVMLAVACAALLTLNGALDGLMSGWSVFENLVRQAVL